MKIGWWKKVAKEYQVWIKCECMNEPIKQSKYIYDRLEKIVSICDEQIETKNKIVDDHAKEGERNAWRSNLL